ASKAPFAEAAKQSAGPLEDRRIPDRLSAWLATDCVRRRPSATIRKPNLCPPCRCTPGPSHRAKRSEFSRVFATEQECFALHPHSHSAHTHGRDSPSAEVTRWNHRPCGSGRWPLETTRGTLRSVPGTHSR